MITKRLTHTSSNVKRYFQWQLIMVVLKCIDIMMGISNHKRRFYYTFQCFFETPIVSPYDQWFMCVVHEHKVPNSVKFN